MIVRDQTRVIAQVFRDFLNTGYVLWKQGEYQRALEHYLEGAEGVKNEGNELLEAKYHIGLGNAYENLGDTDKAWTEYQSALSRARSIEDRGEQGIAENNLAFLLIRLQQFEQAHKYLDKAEESFRQAKDSTNLARTWETRANLYQREFAYRKAVKTSALSTLALIDGVEYDPLIETLITAEQSIKAYKLQLALESCDGSVARAAKKLKTSRQNIERMLKDNFPELEIYAKRGKPRGVHTKKI